MQSHAGCAQRIHPGRALAGSPDGGSALPSLAFATHLRHLSLRLGVNGTMERRIAVAIVSRWLSCSRPPRMRTDTAVCATGGRPPAVAGTGAHTHRGRLAGAGTETPYAPEIVRTGADGSRSTGGRGMPRQRSAIAAGRNMIAFVDTARLARGSCGDPYPHTARRATH